MVTDADIYEMFAAAHLDGRRYGWWRMSSDVLDEMRRRHHAYNPAGAVRLLLGRPVRIVDGVGVCQFVEHPRPPARKHRTMRLR